jgi:hypothetical protein
MKSPRHEGLLIPFRRQIAKETVSAIFAAKLPHGSTPKAAHEKLKIDFANLSKSRARRLLRFWQVREVSARSA